MVRTKRALVIKIKRKPQRKSSKLLAKLPPNCANSFSCFTSCRGPWMSLSGWQGLIEVLVVIAGVPRRLCCDCRGPWMSLLGWQKCTLARVVMAAHNSSFACSGTTSNSQKINLHSLYLTIGRSICVCFCLSMVNGHWSDSSMGPESGLQMSVCHWPFADVTLADEYTNSIVCT